MLNIVAVILARGGSKGIPGKNIVDFCGKPLIVWTIEQLQRVKKIRSIWVSSDSKDILEIGKRYGVEPILRPEQISGDSATSESGWLHALEYINSKGISTDIIFAPQVTSPLRTTDDIERGLYDFKQKNCDSLFSASIAADLFFWEELPGNALRSINYDYTNRKRRQEIPVQYIENGSFYVFTPEIIRRCNNRLGGKIGITLMEYWKMFEINSIEDYKICEALMKAFILKTT